MEESLRGQLLVASPALVDPNFARTVVFITEHSDEGAMGIVLDRPSETAVEALVPQLAEIAGGEAHGIFLGRDHKRRTGRFGLRSDRKLAAVARERSVARGDRLVRVPRHRRSP